MTVEDVKKYAIEKRMPKRGIDDMIRRLSAEHGDQISDELYCLLCAEIDRKAGYWESVRSFLEKRSEERNRERDRLHREKED